jgi:hypothetical protein
MTTDAKVTTFPPTVAEFLLDRYAEDLAEVRNSPTPRRATYECAKNYRILDLHRGPHLCTDGTLYGGNDADPCPTLVTLTIPYSWHPECRDEWREWVTV